MTERPVDDVTALLPFLVNGTLTGKEAEIVQAAVNADPALQAEVSALRAIRTTMQAEPVLSPGEFGLARLMRDLPAQSPLRERPARQPLWQLAAALLLGVVLLQGYWIFRPGDPASYGLAGEESAPLSVIVAPGQTEEALRLVLQSAGAEIVAGPSALGIYSIAPLPGQPVEDVARFLQESGVFETVELNTGE